jgi:hypothetical protein
LRLGTSDERHSAIVQRDSGHSVKPIVSQDNLVLDLLPRRFVPLGEKRLGVFQRLASDQLVVLVSVLVTVRLRDFQLQVVLTLVFHKRAILDTLTPLAVMRLERVHSGDNWLTVNNIESTLTLSLSIDLVTILPVDFSADSADLEQLADKRVVGFSHSRFGSADNCNVGWFGWQSVQDSDEALGTNGLNIRHIVFLPKQVSCGQFNRLPLLSNVQPLSNCRLGKNCLTLSVRLFA